MIQKPLPLILLAFILFTAPAYAGSLPEVLAFEAAIEAAAQIFSSPALPSLDNEGTSLTPVYGIVTMDGIDETLSDEDGKEYKTENRGQIKGEVAGLTFNRSGSGDLGFFATAAWSRVSGEMRTNYTNETKEIRDISAQNYIGVLGLNYRIVGTAKSTFAWGVFGGPAIVSATTSARVYHADGKSTEVLLDPQLTGGYLGMQLMFRIGKFRINPYFNLLAGEPKCYKPAYRGDPYTSSQYNRCMDGDRGVNAVAAIGGAGINIGYGRLGFGLLSVAAGTAGGLQSTPLIFSFRIGL